MRYLPDAPMFIGSHGTIPDAAFRGRVVACGRSLTRNSARRVESATQETQFGMPELEERTSTGKLTAQDAQKGALRLLAHGDNRWDEDEYSPEEELKMIELYAGTLASIDEGEIVKSKVLEIRDNLVILDIGFKSEGAVPLEEFKDHPELKPGDEVEVLLEHLEDQEGSVVLSKKKADFMRV